ncbi:MAG: hypothetical protein R3A13_07475 [Bdellovibrionota bacterium]
MTYSGKIVFAAGKTAELDLWVLDLNAKSLTRLTEGAYWNDSPKWSPDGSMLAFTSNRTGYPQIYLMAADGSDQMQITNGEYYHGDPSWSPDGNTLVFCANYGDQSKLGVWAITPDGSAPEVIISDAGVITQPVWSPDGNYIYLSSTRSGHYDIWSFNLSTSEWQQLTGGNSEEFAPAISPDGKTIAYISNAQDKAEERTENSSIWLMNINGTNKRRVTQTPGDDKHVSWAPSSKQLVYCASYPSSASERLRTVDLLTDNAMTMVFDRGPILERLKGSGAEHKQGLMSVLGLVPDKLGKMFYDASYQGTERRPDWK